MALKGNELVEKKNELNEIPIDKMSFIEMRIFLIYLAKINPRDMSTRSVKFELADIYEYLDRSQIKISNLKLIAKNLLTKIVYLPYEGEGFQSFPLFNVCTVHRDEYDKWYMEIDAHDHAMPLLFDYKARYFKYRLNNVLRLSSSNQIILYNQLKQYEWVGSRVITVSRLKQLFGIDDGKQMRWDNFRAKVLLSCQKALAENTDICFTFEPIRAGRNHETVAVRFFIKKNEDALDQIMVSEYLNGQDENEIAPIRGEINNTSQHRVGVDMEFLAEAFANEFSLEEVEYLYRLALPYVQSKKSNMSIPEIQLELYDYFALKYSQLKAKSSSVKRSRFGLLRSFVEADANGIGRGR